MYVMDASGQPLTSGFQLPQEFLPTNIYYHSSTTLIFLVGNGVSCPHPWLLAVPSGKVNLVPKLSSAPDCKIVFAIYFLSGCRGEHRKA